MKEPSKALRVIERNLGASAAMWTKEGDLEIAFFEGDRALLGPMMCAETSNALDEIARYLHWVKNERCKK